MKVNNLIPQMLFPLQSYLLDCQARALRPQSIRFYEEHCTWFLAYCQAQGILQPGDVTPALVRAYLVELSARGWRPASVASAYRALRVFFGFLERDELIGKSPMRKVAVPKEETTIKGIFTKADIQKLLAAAESERDKALILFLLDTGARVSEALAVNVGDVEIGTGRVFLRETKDREQRIVYVGVQARRQLLHHYRTLDIAPETPLWMDMRSQRRLLRNGVNQLLRRLGRKAKVAPCNPHRFRRTFAVTFLRNGGDIFVLQRLLGHSTLEMVNKYLDGLNDDDAAQAHRKFAPGDRMAVKLGT